MNVVSLLGRFTRDNELRHPQSGMAILSNTVAVNRMKKDESDFISVKAFDKTAENINKFFGKGSLICIQGHIQTGKYTDKDNRTVYTTDVIIDRWDFTGERKNDTYAERMGDGITSPAGSAEFAEITDDDESLPF